MSDAIWFYINAQQEKIGPVAASEVKIAYEQGKMRLDSLVWSQDLPQWQALSDHLATFDINLKPVETTQMASGEQVKYAHFIHRWAAHLIDNTLLLSTTFLVIAAVILIIALASGEFINENSEATMMFSLFGGIFAIFFLYPVLSGTYHTLLEGSAKQGSWGKQYLGIVVTTDKGGKVDRTKAFTRWLSSFVSHMTQSIGFIIAAFTPRRQALHDYIVGTLVVENPRATVERNTRATWAIILCVLVFPLLLTAAIAIPAFIIIKKAEALKETAFNDVNTAIAPVKAAVTAYYEKNASCPDETESTLAAVLAPLKAKTTSVTIGETSDQDGCEIYATYGTGRYVWYRMDVDKQWTYEVETSNSFDTYDSDYSDVQPAVDDAAAAPVEELSAVEQAQASAATAAMRAEVVTAAAPIKALVQAQYTKDASCLTNDDKALADVIGALKDKSTDIIIGPTEAVEGCEIYVEFGDAQYLWYRINQDKQWSEETDETDAEAE
jgi:uncharacterized RDD family membrane protein YckC